MEVVHLSLATEFAHPLLVLITKLLKLPVIRHLKKIGELQRSLLVVSTNWSNSSWEK